MSEQHEARVVERLLDGLARAAEHRLHVPGIHVARVERGQLLERADESREHQPSIGERFGQRLPRAPEHGLHVAGVEV